MVDSENSKALEASYGPDIAIPPTGEGMVAEKNIDPNVQHVLAEVPADLTQEDSKRVLRKLDLCLMPMMCLVVLFQFLDKTSLNYANLVSFPTVPAEWYTLCSKLIRVFTQLYVPASLRCPQGFIGH